MKPSTASSIFRSALRRIVETHRTGKGTVSGSVAQDRDTKERDPDILIGSTPAMAAIQNTREHTMGVTLNVPAGKALIDKFRASTL